MEYVSLNNGEKMPAFGLGTWKSEPGEVREAVLEAVRAGYRHIDCAWIYQNEAEIGEALAELFATGVVERKDLWITSKLWNNAHAAQDVAPALRETLANLGLDYLDLYLIHWPVAQHKAVVFPQSAADLVALEQAPLSATWAALESLVDAGLSKSIGVSNFKQATLESLLGEARITPAVNQIELHPYLPQTELVSFCQKKGVAVTAYSPLGSRDRPEIFKAADEPVLLDDPTVAEIAASNGATAGQILIAWALSRDTMVIPKSVNPARLRENFAACSIQLSDDDRLKLDTLNRQRRYVDGSFMTMPGSPYAQADLWG